MVSIKKLRFGHHINGDQPVEHIIGVRHPRIKATYHFVDKFLSKDLSASQALNRTINHSAEVEIVRIAGERTKVNRRATRQYFIDLA